VDAAVRAAAGAFPAWRATPILERVDLCRRAYTLCMERNEEIAQMITREMGKTIRESREEMVEYTADHFRRASEDILRHAGQVLPSTQERAGTKRILVVQEPVGVVAAVTPWNFPVDIAGIPIVYGLAAGCTIVWKPSEFAPLCAGMFVELLEDAGFPAGTVNLVHGRGETVGKALSKGAVVVYESTVYPGVTEDICGPILAKVSGLARADFKLGYSPERINPGDHEHTLERITKVVSGEDAPTLARVAAAYSAIIDAGIHKAQSIKVAEAAKVIENTQRDVNIALINELALIFNRLGIDTEEVLLAAGTKWNFLPFRPGLVGGHCIGVDPYYLTHKAESVGFHPQMILAGRRINDGMASYVAGDVVKTMLKRKQRVENARVLIMGFTFKENCPDTRNTKVADLVQELASLVAEVAVYDPVADIALAKHEYGITLSNTLPGGPFDAVVLAVKHDRIAGMGEAAIRNLLAPNGLIYDIKGILPASASNARL
jgi:UDP-N-acetyl-D-galactosamine dehydrogenase